MESNNHHEGMVITVTELKQNLGKYMDLVEAQNEVVITKNGKKTARLTPPSIAHQEILGRLYIAFTTYFKEGKCRVFIAPCDIHFRKKDFKEENNVTENGRYMGTPALVVRNSLREHPE